MFRGPWRGRSYPTNLYQYDAPFWNQQQLKNNNLLEYTGCPAWIALSVTPSWSMINIFDVSN